jgi:hypothetical protein
MADFFTLVCEKRIRMRLMFCPTKRRSLSIASRKNTYGEHVVLDKAQGMQSITQGNSLKEFVYAIPFGCLRYFNVAHRVPV